MGGRTHLSIGEVLSLLQADFPDLTITKIRFLESQGLIDPERTPSGYRKFYEFDIERLRWILRQQRENFLPLKVIKGRLEGVDGNHDGQTTTPSQEQLDLARDPGPADPPPVWMADHARVTAGVGSPSASAPEPASGSAQQPPPKAPSKRSAPASSPEPKATAPKRPAAPVAPAPTTASAPTPKRATHSNPSPAHAGRTQEATMPAPEPPKPSTPAAQPKTVDPLDLGMSDVSLSKAELASAAGLTDAQLDELESFGLVAPMHENPDPIYGADALMCARHAATFFALGVEARHLRGFKLAADREAGLYEQLILPLLRQRNPAARKEAADVLAQVSSAGAAIHAALLHQSLRPHL